MTACNPRAVCCEMANLGFDGRNCSERCQADDDCLVHETCENQVCTRVLVEPVPSDIANFCQGSCNATAECEMPNDMLLPCAVRCEATYQNLDRELEKDYFVRLLGCHLDLMNCDQEALSGCLEAARRDYTETVCSNGCTHMLALCNLMDPDCVETCAEAYVQGDQEMSAAVTSLYRCYSQLMNCDNTAVGECHQAAMRAAANAL